MIVASDGFKHFGRFLTLCGVPEVVLEADPASSNVQFFTEYGFEESLTDGAEKRFRNCSPRNFPWAVTARKSKGQSICKCPDSLFLGNEPAIPNRNLYSDCVIEH